MRDRSLIERIAGRAPGRPKPARTPLYVGPRPRSTASAPRGGEQLSSERPGDSCLGGRSAYSTIGGRT